MSLKVELDVGVGDSRKNIINEKRNKRNYVWLKKVERPGLLGWSPWPRGSIKLEDFTSSQYKWYNLIGSIFMWMIGTNLCHGPTCILGIQFDSVLTYMSHLQILIGLILYGIPQIDRLDLNLNGS